MRRLAAAPFAFVCALLLVALSAGGCGSRSLLDYGDGGIVSPEGSPEGSLPQGCGDGVCSATESCSTCSVDCGVCKTCGDKVCEESETCGSCPEDCGVCTSCGDGYCNGSETCENCAPDCGACQSCGDGRCSAPTEDCFTCPADCGKCAGCGDGTCTAPETCASCTQDCGVCSVCGNGKCEPPYETCTNCPGDCGQCPVLDCLQVIECVLPCLGGATGGGSITPAAIQCALDCETEGCANAQDLIGQTVVCILSNFSTCQPASFSCFQQVCGNSISACLGASCK